MYMMMAERGALNFNAANILQELCNKGMWWGCGHHIVIVFPSQSRDMESLLEP
jgi:hypothetical protein